MLLPNEAMYAATFAPCEEDVAGWKSWDKGHLSREWVLNPHLFQSSLVREGPRHMQSVSPKHWQKPEWKANEESD